MRVNGRTKPTGAMKVITGSPQGGLGRSLETGRPRRPAGVTFFPPRARGPSVPHASSAHSGSGRGAQVRDSPGRTEKAARRRYPDVSASTSSINVGTRKIVNYAWPG